MKIYERTEGFEVDYNNEEISAMDDEYGWLWDDNGGDTDGSAILISKSFIRKQDLQLFEKTCTKLDDVLVVSEYEGEDRDILRMLFPELDSKYQWMGHQAAGFAFFNMKQRG